MITDYEIERDLNGMLGKLFIYNKKRQRILRFSVNDKLVKIISDQQDIVILRDDYRKQIGSFLTVEEDSLPVQEIKPVPVQDSPRTSMTVAQPGAIISSSGQELKNILMDNIKKVSENKDYIPQAVEISNQVKTFIELAKTEVELIRVMKQ